MVTKTLAMAALLAAMALPVRLAAQDQPAAAAALADAVEQCRTIADAEPRLACFDRTTAAFAQARAAKEIVLVDRQVLRETRRSLFGFSLPKLRLFAGRGDEAGEPEITQIDTTITSASGAGYSRMNLSLADGSHWQTTEGIPFHIAPGSKITIKRGAIGGFLANFGSGGFVRVKRID